VKPPRLSRARRGTLVTAITVVPAEQLPRVTGGGLISSITFPKCDALSPDSNP
jgi:hypothetical protein